MFELSGFYCASQIKAQAVDIPPGPSCSRPHASCGVITLGLSGEPMYSPYISVCCRGWLKEVSKSVQVLFRVLCNGIEAVFIRTLIILK